MATDALVAKKKSPPPLFNVEVGCLDGPSEKKASTLKRGGEEGVE